MTVRSEFDWESTSPSTAVVESVAEAVGTEPRALDALYGSIDPDGIDILMRDGASDHPQPGLCVSFRYADHEVTVDGSGVVTVRQTDADGRRTDPPGS